MELGITFWDTANVYQAGTSEQIVGRAITTYSRREDIVLATKVRGRMHDGPGGEGLSRRAILEQLDASLARLGTERDRIESAEPAFHQRVRTGFLAQADADPERWAVLDGSADIERVGRAVEALVEERLGLVIVDR